MPPPPPLPPLPDPPRHRLVAGAGAAVLGIGGSYITRTSTLRKRQAKLGRYRITQNVARSVGPLIG